MARTIAFVCLLIPSLARADDLFSVSPSKSSVSYTLIHKLHTVHGVATKNIEAKAKVGAAGAQLAVRIPIASFDSQNGNRDEHMQETVEAAKFPSVELKAVAPNAKVQASGESQVTLKGKLTFHGVTQDVEVPLTLTWASAKDVTVKGKFPVSLESYKVERPSLMGWKVEDKIDIDIDLHMVE
jgi:polyisoprenoid-binding protein YceI